MPLPLHQSPLSIADVWAEPGKRGFVHYSVEALPNHRLQVSLRTETVGHKSFGFSFQVLFPAGNTKGVPLSDRKRTFRSDKDRTASWDRLYSVYQCEACEEVKIEIHPEP
jgi:hypothetical protein